MEAIASVLCALVLLVHAWMCPYKMIDFKVFQNENGLALLLPKMKMALPSSQR